MDEYIKREDALEIVIRTCGDYATAFAEIGKLPAADVTEVKHGYWIEKPNPWGQDGSHTYICSVCNEQISVLGNKPPYCLHCVAKMDGKKAEKK